MGPQPVVRTISARMGKGSGVGRCSRGRVRVVPPTPAPPAQRRLYDPEVDGAGHQVRTDNDFDPAAAARGALTRAGVAAALGYGPESVDLSEGAQSLTRPPIALRQPTEGTSISLTDKDVFTGVLVVRNPGAA